MTRIKIFSSLLLTLLICWGLDLTEATRLGSPTTKSPIDFDDVIIDDEPAVGGSGSGKLPFSDDEDIGESGSGSGSGQGAVDFEPEAPQVTTPRVKATTLETTTTSTQKPLSMCERAHAASKQLGNSYVPQCRGGHYDSTQCQGERGESDCWCSDKFGKPIPGTRMEQPNVPDCDTGDNLSHCVFTLVKTVRTRADRLGGFVPKCDEDGHYHPKQCSGSMCYCVERVKGKQISSTLVPRNSMLNCEEDDKETELPTTPEITPKPTDSSDEEEEEEDKSDENPIVIVDPTEETDIKIPDSQEKDNGNVNIDANIEDKNDDDKDTDTNEVDSNKISEDVEDEIKSDRQLDTKPTKMKAASPIMAQPGPLAGIIGGSVVVALCLVLLIMFIIYRMRKKDEGSYPLDDSRKPPKYPYMRAPEREFYA